MFGMIIIDIPSVLEVLPVVLEIQKEVLLLVKVCQMLGLVSTFIDDFILLITEQPTQFTMLINGDFNLDQMLPENAVKVDTLI